MARQRALLALLVVAVALAGCAAGTGDAPAATATPTGSAAPAGGGQPALVDNVLAASRDVAAYHLDATIERRIETNNRVTETTVESAVAFDRAARELAATRTVTGPSGSVETATYVANGSLYRRSAAFERRYGSAWVRLDVAERLTATWDRLDTLARQRALLANASVRVVERTTLNGTAVTVLAVDGNETAYEDALADRLASQDLNGSIAVQNVSFTYTVATDTGRLLRSTGRVASEVRAGGTAVALEESLTLSFRYAPVDVTLPDGAETAVTIDAAGS